MCFEPFLKNVNYNNCKAFCWCVDGKKSPMNEVCDNSWLIDFFLLLITVRELAKSNSPSEGFPLFMNFLTRANFLFNFFPRKISMLFGMEFFLSFFEFRYTRKTIPFRLTAELRLSEVYTSSDGNENKQRGAGEKQTAGFGANKVERIFFFLRFRCQQKKFQFVPFTNFTNVFVRTV